MRRRKMTEQEADAFLRGEVVRKPRKKAKSVRRAPKPMMTTMECLVLADEIGSLAYAIDKATKIKAGTKAATMLAKRAITVADTIYRAFGAK